MGPRKNWTYDDDVILLRQVNADRPFAAKKGAVMEEWNLVADKIKGLSKFTRYDIDGKKAQNRFIALLNKHVENNKDSARAFGVSEDYREKQELLDDLLCLVNDHKADESARTTEEKKKEEEDIAAGANVHEAAMQALGKRSTPDVVEDSPQKRNKIVTMMASLSEDIDRRVLVKEEELALRRMEREDRVREWEIERRQHELDRDERVRIAEIKAQKAIRIAEIERQKAEIERQKVESEHEKQWIY